MSLKVGDRVRLTIEKMSIGSGGVARTDNLVVFVPRSAPGDQVLVEIVQLKDRFGRGRILEILSPGPQRIPPPCPYYDRCGGCSWQHLAYPEQLRQKQSLVREQLERFLHREIPMLEIQGSPAEFRYRERVRLKFQDGGFGYYRERSHQFVAIEDCLIVDEPLIAEAHRLRDTGATTTATEFEILRDNQGAIVATDLGQEAGTFTQANRGLNSELVTTAVQWLTESAPERVFDLYCGSGNFSFELLRSLPTAPLTGIESSLPAIKAAQARARSLGISPKLARFHSARVEVALETLTLPSGTGVLLDPPRDGCDPFVMEALAEAAPRSIVYVSCHPSSLARDLQTFFKHAPPEFRLKRVQAFDMFPQTEHVETIVEIGN